MAMNLEAVLRIAAKVVGLDDVTKLERGIAGAEKAASSAQGAFKAVVSSASWQAAAVAAGAFAVGIGLAARAAIDFESSMADVRKVVSGLETPKAFAEIKTEILELSRQMPVAAKGFAEIYAAAGQSGIARGELKEFATLVAQVGIAFDMTAGEAGRALAQLKVALGLSTPEVRSLADAMNYVSNNTGATAANLVEFMSRAGAVGKLAGLSGQQTMAFGAAMIQTGIQSEVAATSFNNMIKALSKGPSMTDRQVSALSRLGYSMVDAGKAEQELTRIAESDSRRRVQAAETQKNEIVRLAEEQSRRRLEVARDETDQLSREINRRYRNEQQALQDVWDDEASAREDALQDDASARIKHLQRMEREEMKSAQEQARAAGVPADAAVDAIRDRYEYQIDLIRDGVERQLKMERRAARDQQQVVRDVMQDMQDEELKANEEKYKALEQQEKQHLEAQKKAAEDKFKAYQESEKAFLEMAKGEAKKTGEALALASSQGFADRLQENAIGTIMEVLGKIRDLPKSQQVSVLSDLFGDEARGLAPLLANLGELERILGLAGDKGAYTSSVMDEFAIRSETAANKIQLFNNNMAALQITTGEKLLPALVKILEYVTPMVEAFAGMAAANPVMTTIALSIAGIASALILAAPGVLALVTLFGQMGGVIAPLVAGIKLIGSAFAFAFGSGLVPLITGALGLLKGFALAALGFFSGPVGWTVLAVAAVVAAAIAFREPLMKFVGWLWELGEPIRKFWIDLWGKVKELAHTMFVQPLINVWEAIKEPVKAAFEFIKGVVEWFGNTAWALFDTLWLQPFLTVWGNVRDTVLTAWTVISEKAGEAFKGIMKLANDWLVKPWVNLWEKVLRKPITDFWTEVQKLWKQITDWWEKNVTKPLVDLWELANLTIREAMTRTGDTIKGAWEGIINGIKGLASGFLNAWINAINGVIRGVNNLISAFNALPGSDISFIPELSPVAFAEGGIVNRPTLAMVGEGGEREYIVPESKMAAASSRYLAGSRGADVIPSTSTAPASAAAPTINVTTGPVLEFDGRRYVTVEDYHRGLRQVADGVIGRLRTPASRRALGMST
jgi:TP901 family phage tail tape measure protein